MLPGGTRSAASVFDLATTEKIVVTCKYTAQLGEMIRNLSSQSGGGDPPSDVDISSIGVAEKLIRQSFGTPEAGFDVKTASVGVEILSGQGVTFVWTFRGRPNLSAVYNESFHPVDQMDRFISEVKNHLLNSLNIQDSETNLP
ncbi:hypothetical protein F4801DRAFT_563796 [Xylaria longipes]|nr:hypothetical protein F4801DRAFT_563796 [Xylaria longipes]